MEEALHLADRMTYMMTKGVVSAEEYGGGLYVAPPRGERIKNQSYKGNNAAGMDDGETPLCTEAGQHGGWRDGWKMTVTKLGCHNCKQWGKGGIGSRWRLKSGWRQRGLASTK